MTGINKAKFAVAGLVVAAPRCALGSGSCSQTPVKLILWSRLWPCHATPCLYQEALQWALLPGSRALWGTPFAGG